MSMDEFLAQLTHRLGYLPYAEVKKTTDFYREAIADRMEDGMTEREAVAAVGSLDDIVREIEMNLPLSTVVKTRVEDARERAKERRGNLGLKIVILILTFPIWFSLLAAGFAVVFSLAAGLFALVLAFGAAEIALIVGGLVTAVLALVILPYPGLAPRLMLSGAGLLMASLGLLVIPVTALMEKIVSGVFRYTARVVKRCILRGRGTEA